MESNAKLAYWLNAVAQTCLLIISISVFLFALVSGSEAYGGGIEGIIKNSPNAWPWLVLLILVLIVRKWKLVGGILLFLLGVGLVYFFNFSGPNFWWSTFFMTLSVPVFGLLIILSWYLQQPKTEQR